MVKGLIPALTSRLSPSRQRRRQECEVACHIIATVRKLEQWMLAGLCSALSLHSVPCVGNWPAHIKMGLPTIINTSKITLHRHVQEPILQVILESVNLTACIIIHIYEQYTCIMAFNRISVCMYHMKLMYFCLFSVISVKCSVSEWSLPHLRDKLLLIWCYCDHACL